MIFSQVQPLPNPMMRQYLQMKKEQSGVLVTKVFYRNSAWGVLKESTYNTYNSTHVVLSFVVTLVFSCFLIEIEFILL
jgi:hypothetical protein